MSTYHMLINDVDEAVGWSRRGIRFARRLGWGFEYTGLSLFTLVCCVTKRGDLELAATLLGAYEALEAVQEGRVNWSWTPLETRERENNRQVMMRALGDEQFSRVADRGRELSFESAVSAAFLRLAPVA